MPLNTASLLFQSIEYVVKNFHILMIIKRSKGNAKEDYFRSIKIEQRLLWLKMAFFIKIEK